MSTSEKVGVDLDVADVAAVDAALACDRADDRTRLHAVLLTHLDAIARTGAGCRAAAAATTGTVRASLNRAVFVATGLESGADELAGLVQLFLTADLAITATILLDAGGGAIVANSRRHEGGGDVLDGHLTAEVGEQTLIHVETATLDASGQALE